jgi:hypothetical protein
MYNPDYKAVTSRTLLKAAEEPYLLMQLSDANWTAEEYRRLV